MGQSQKPAGGKKCPKLGVNASKCALYRARVGKPRGPGRPGCKSGKRWAPR